MNTNISPYHTHRYSRGLLRATCLSAFSLIAMFVGAPQAADAAIIANFTGGNGTAQVDQYAGIAGNGWMGAWGPNFYTGIATNNSTVKTSSSTGYNPLKEDENYLSIRFDKQKSATAVGGAHLYRQYGDYGDIRLTQAHTVSFTFRIDSPMDRFDAITIWDSSHGAINASASNQTRWQIDVSSSNTWQFLDNSGRVESNIEVKTGNIYQFVITLDPEFNRYKVSLEDLTDGESYVSSFLNFAYKTGNKASGTLRFGAVPISDPNATVSVEMSLGNLVVAPIPEGSTVAMLLSGGALLAWVGARRSMVRCGTGKR